MYGNETIYEIMGYGSKIEKLNTEVMRVAPTDFSVLILGETGSGKEVVAQKIHNNSSRQQYNFVTLDCGAIPETLFSNELFGHAKGAFTGADKTQQGKFMLSSKGTLFIDEISNLSLSMQTNLMRVLQENYYYKLGGDKCEVTSRVLTASNSNLTYPSTNDEFRQDLFHRIAEYVINVPTLRERKEDIEFLVQRFIEITNRKISKNVKGISQSALDILYSYDWPGNVRELKNVISKAVLLADSIITPEHLHIYNKNILASVSLSADSINIGEMSLKQIMDGLTSVVEEEILNKVLEKAKWNKAEAARILKIDYKTILSKMNKYGIKKL